MNTHALHLANVIFRLVEGDSDHVINLHIDAHTLDSRDIGLVLQMVCKDLTQQHSCSAHFNKQTMAIEIDPIDGKEFTAMDHAHPITTEHIRQYIENLKSIVRTKEDLIALADFCARGGTAHQAAALMAANSSTPRTPAFTPENIYNAVANLLVEFGDEYSAVPVTYALEFRRDECKKTRCKIQCTGSL